MLCMVDHGVILVYLGLNKVLSGGNNSSWVLMLTLLWKKRDKYLEA